MPTIINCLFVITTKYGGLFLQSGNLSQSDVATGNSIFHFGKYCVLNQADVNILNKK